MHFLARNTLKFKLKNKLKYHKPSMQTSETTECDMASDQNFYLTLKLGRGVWEDMHFVWFSMWEGFFSPRVSESRPSRVATRVGFGDEWWEIHLTWKTIQHAFSRILYTLRHFNQAKFTWKSCRSWKPCEMDFSHNCSLHGGRSDVCDNNRSCLWAAITEEGGSLMEEKSSTKYTGSVFFA